MCVCLSVRFDKADGLYDTGDAWSDMRAEFESRATYRMKVIIDLSWLALSSCMYIVCMYVCMYV